MDEEGTKSAHKILNLNCQQGAAVMMLIPFH